VPIIKLLLILIIVFTLIGFLWFVISYPEKTDGDTVKSTYIIQAIILLPLVVGMYVNELLKKHAIIWLLLIFMYGLIFIINFVAFFSHSVSLSFIKLIVYCIS